MATTAHTGKAAEADSTVSAIVRARHAVFAATGTFVIGMLLFVGYLWELSGGLAAGEDMRAGDWLALAGLVWLPVVAVAAYRLVRVHPALAVTAREAVAAFQDTVHTAQGWVWQIDTDHRIVYSSDGIRALLGHEPEEVLGMNAVDLMVVDEDRPMIMAGIQASFDQDGWQNWLTKVKHRDGSFRYVRSSATPVRAAGGHVVSYRGFTADVTAEVVAAESERNRERELQEARARIEWVLDHPEALNVFYQPIVDVAAQRASGVEALSRFAGEPYRTPDVWFDEAWRVGLGLDLELHAITLACQQLSRMPPGAYLSINASPRTVVDQRFADFVERLGADAHRVVVEVTEHAVVDDYERLSAAVQQLRHAGLRLAVDDAGAGYSSLQHILKLRPDIIKLDRGIIAGLDQDPAKRALAVAIGGFAASFDMKVVAEGVETTGELAVLSDIGIDHVQGYLLARPSADPAYVGEVAQHVSCALLVTPS